MTDDLLEQRLGELEHAVTQLANLVDSFHDEFMAGLNDFRDQIAKGLDDRAFNDYSDPLDEGD